MLTSCFFEIMLKANKKLLKQNAESLSELTRTQRNPGMHRLKSYIKKIRIITDMYEITVNHLKILLV